MKIRPVEADKLTDGRTDMANITVAFSNFENAPKKKTGRCGSILMAVEQAEIVLFNETRLATNVQSYNAAR
jgi:predicted membrane protein